MDLNTATAIGSRDWNGVYGRMKEIKSSMPDPEYIVAVEVSIEEN